MTQAELEPGALTSKPAKRTWSERLRAAGAVISGYFRDQDPTFWVAFTPALLLAALLFVRSPFSNYIFDEQEALLANPYVNGQQGLGFWDAVRRDFWGLPPDRSIGSYRPIPNLVWRSLWRVSTLPFFHHWVNVVGHAVNGAILASFAFALTRDRKLGWLAGACFTSSAVLTEAVSGVVGIADVLGGLGVLGALAALRLPLLYMPFGVFSALSFGLFSKESAIVGVPLLAWVALVSAPALHARPRRVERMLLALVAGVLALVVYTEFRRRFFPVTLPAELTQALPADAPLHQKLGRKFLVWFQQPQLPNDPINNPLVLADTPHRIAGALRVFFRGLVQMTLPWNLSGDYSFSAEPAPERLVFPESVLGALLLVGLPVLGAAAWLRSLFERSDQRARELMGIAIGTVWIVIAYFPHSNIPVSLPTVRAERFWYLPAIGTALLFGTLFARLLRKPGLGPRAVLAFFVVHAIQARAHAFAYRDDLAFWSSTRNAAPNSAKAHLNYSVMVGARGRLEERLAANERALEIAPKWPMAWIYYGDTLCRLNRVAEAWPYYEKGFELAPNDPNLIALSLQCLWDHDVIDEKRNELLALSSQHPGSWLSYLATDIVYSGTVHGGVQKKYRPRSYDEGPKQE